MLILNSDKVLKGVGTVSRIIFGPRTFNVSIH